jgi:hypothetical protein
MELNHPATLRSEAYGTVCSVDPINRDLIVQVGRSQVCFDVPPTCTISLRAERVRLRMLQPGDRVNVLFDEAAGVATARAIEAQPPR